MPEIISGKKEPMGGMDFKKCWNKNCIEKLSRNKDYGGICDICLSPPSNWFLTATHVGIIELLVCHQYIKKKSKKLLWLYVCLVGFSQITNDLMVGMKGLMSTFYCVCISTCPKILVKSVYQIHPSLVF